MPASEDEHPHLWQTIATNAKLIALAQERAMDEPLLHGRGPQFSAANNARRCLKELPSGAKNAEAYLQLNLGNALRFCGPQYDAEAQEAFARALSLAPEQGAWWSDLGLLHKWRGRFEQGLDCFLKARARLGEERSLLWNIAICATALGDGDLAAGIWQQLGMQASLHPKSGMPYVEGIPPRLIRVLSRDAELGSKGAVSFECVWVIPLSPCHGVVASPTFRDAPIDDGDVVLWDGAAVASRSIEGRDVPVFPLLEILRRSDERRFAFVAHFPKHEASLALAEALSDSTRIFLREEASAIQCAGCAEGIHVAKHAHQSDQERAVAFGKMILPAEQELEPWRRQLEETVRKQGIAIAIPALYESLGDTKKAGQQHKAWHALQTRAGAGRAS